MSIFFNTANNPYDCLSFIRKFDSIEVPEDQILVFPGQITGDKREKLSQSPGSPEFIFQGFIIIPGYPLQVHPPRPTLMALLYLIYGKSSLSLLSLLCERRLNVGFGEVVSFEEKRFARVFRQGIGAAIADVEPGSPFFDSITIEVSNAQKALRSLFGAFAIASEKTPASGLAYILDTRLCERAVASRTTLCQVYSSMIKFMLISSLEIHGMTVLE